MDKQFEAFQHPTAAYRGKPFWSWNGKLEKEELLRQVHVMKEMGFGGFFMHSRTGLETEYLGDEWFDLINACADEAESLGMEAWLYDEDRWPSGIAGGLVTEDPEFRMKSVKLTLVEDPADFVWDDQILAAFSADLTGVDLAGYARIGEETPRETLNGKKVLVFRVIDMSENSFYNGYTYVDTLNAKATRRFLETTHEKYKVRCGDRLGRSIKGIFTDEPHRGTLMDEFGAGNDKDIWRAPWTALLPEIFCQIFGYDLVGRLPELFLRYAGSEVSQVKWHYVETVQRMFLDNYAKPINEWCEANGILLTGHVLHEDSLTAQTAMNGSVMRYYEHMGYPGIDVLTEGNRGYWIVKQLSSAARQLGKKWLLSELYGCTGWQMNFESHKAVGDWQALFGINLRCHHLSWYTMESEAKRDYPASILHQSTWWREYRYVEDYFSRIGVALGQGKPCCDVLVMNPVESVWSQVRPGWAKNLSALSPAVVALEKQYVSLFHWLVQARIDFDYGDEEMVGRMFRIGRDSEGTPLLLIGEASYRTVVVSGMTTLRSSTLEVLRMFLHAGGKVVLAGDAPAFVDALASDAAAKTLGSATHIPFTEDALVAAVQETTRVRIEVADKAGRNLKDIFCQAVEDGSRMTLLFLNTNREEGYEEVTLRIRTSGQAEEWMAASGERHAAGQASEDGWLTLVTDFESGREHLYVVTPERNPSLVPAPVFIEEKALPLEGPYRFTLDEPNVCVLDKAAYRLDGGEWQAETEILKVDQKVRNTYGLPLRGGEMLQPWFAGRHGFEVKGKLALRFAFRVEAMPEEPVELVLERPENFVVSVNGQVLEDSSHNGKHYGDSSDKEWWIDKCFRRRLLPTGILREGINTVELQVDFHEGINLEALYLIGRFGVKIGEGANTLVSLPEHLFAGDVVPQGLPFYSGKIRYCLPIPAEAKATSISQGVLSLEAVAGACAKNHHKGWRRADDGLASL